MLKRIRRLWELSKKRPEEVEKLLKLNKEDFNKIKNDSEEKAEFLSEGTQKDYEEFLKEEKGLDKWYKRILNL